MGMYDGDFSTAHLANLLQVPVVLVVDAYGMAESVGAVVKGFSEFGARTSLTRFLSQTGEGLADKDNSIAECGVKNKREDLSVPLAGVIFNRVASENHYQRLQDAVRDVPVLGYLPRELNFEIPHRHLGLTVADENPLTLENLDKLAETVSKHVDLEAIGAGSGFLRESEFRAAGSAQEGAKIRKAVNKFKIAVARDKAFCFYYEDNLELLSNAGAEIICFSPLADTQIPAVADAVYIGGGYPELHAGELSRNVSMLQSLRSWSNAGKPIYAECGGLMYLSQGILDFDNKIFPMAGVYGFGTRMMKKPRLAYREIVLNEDCVLGKKGDTCRGHEFHYSEIVQDSGDMVRQTKIYKVRDKKGLDVPAEGFREKNTLASYIHVHFGSNPHMAERFARFVTNGIQLAG
jgi:cobyrinic acid a,c-diamide synthase